MRKTNTSGNIEIETCFSFLSVLPYAVREVVIDYKLGFPTQVDFTYAQLRALKLLRNKIPIGNLFENISDL